ncbi:MAG: hypothetical protein QG657_3897, partial [Acidobacteriota bacterium]|nr:hypothetical protein [Acidobacteriota bacterium]
MNNKRILVIEDEKDQRVNTCFILGQVGYGTIDADDGVKG